MIAVSGASGFLGSHVVCILLEKGEKVRAFKRERTDLSEFNYIFSVYFAQLSPQLQQDLRQNLTWVIADVTDIPSLEDALEGVYEVYHCAAIVSFLQKDRDKLMQVNVGGTANMVNISLLKDVKKFCYVSSIAALGREKSGDHITEKTHWVDSKINSNYAISKYKAELEVWRGVEEGLNAVIVNPGVILGTGDWNKGSCKLFKLAGKGMPLYTLGINGYVDVKDVSRAMIELMQKNTFAERFILVGENVQMKSFFDSMSDHFGKKKPTVEVGKFLAEAGWIVDGIRSFFKGKEATITKETARASLNKFYYSGKKITDTIGFQYTPMTYTIQQTCAHFLNSYKTT